MNVSAQSVIRRAGIILQDTDFVRWTTAELVDWLNDAQRETVLYRPDSNSKILTATLSPGFIQDLSIIPEAAALNPVMLIDVVRNTSPASQRKSIRRTERDSLDNILPSWANSPSSADIVHFMYDARTPMRFMVYPPATAQAQVELVVSSHPSGIPTPATQLLSGVTGDLEVSPIYANALLDYVLYRAYLKDSEFSGDSSRAMAHYAAFGNSIGVELKSNMAAAPGGTFDKTNQ